jgi:hypothetical protein
MNAIKLIVTQTGDTFEAAASGWPFVGRGQSFKEAIGEWVLVNHMSTNLQIDGPVFHQASAPGATPGIAQPSSSS